ncbi:hypothetical protein LF887_03520 [Chryseobacterium sp. MEBOG06]|uniref:hypothetical protein n=1 Tax=Chryseobacterium sp. MEBOG06 TaxID=2879938 RepID=UPI001F255257|nr:hypothetical protein [Chryseobacterium sp. MEBOG06]UKB84726.1 hypothetical protein LF887_03520 [Chryseobacterium sp. MEBOG06]
MQEDLKKEFSSMVSKPSWVITWLMNIFGGAVLLIMFITLAVFPFLVSGSIKVFVVVTILYYPAWAVGMYQFFHYVKKNMAIAIKKIIVDDKGIHFYKKDGGIDEILYSQLGLSRLSDDYEVYISQRRKSWMLAVGIDRSETKVAFDGTHLGSIYYIKNARALRARFVEGIAHFRPDLRIDPLVFEEFSIHPEKFTFDGKRYMKHIIEIAVTVSVLLLISVLILIVIKIV